MRIVAMCLVLSMLVVPKGDVNGDGRITITDLAQMRQMASGLTTCSLVADMNYDGFVNEIDLQILRATLAKKGTKQ